MEDLALQNVLPILHWEDSIIYIYVEELRELYLETNILIFQCDFFNIF